MHDCSAAITLHLQRMLTGCCNAGLLTMHSDFKPYNLLQLLLCPIPESNHKCSMLQVLTDLPAVERMAAAKDLHAFLDKYHKHAYRLVTPCALQRNLPVPMWRMGVLPVADRVDGCSLFLVGCAQMNQRSAHNVLTMFRQAASVCFCPTHSLWLCRYAG